MPNKLDDAKRRVTYAEWTDIYDLIKEIADAERRDVSDIVRQATQQYVDSKNKKQPSKKSK